MSKTFQFLTPDWSTAPAWANWVAMEYNGGWNWYEKKPEYDDGTWIINYDTNEEECVKLYRDDALIKSTLTRRPFDVTNVKIDQKWKAKGTNYIVRSIEDENVFCSDDFGFSWKGSLADFVEKFTLFS